jgi:hypothetical protein
MIESSSPTTAASVYFDLSFQAGRRESESSGAGLHGVSLGYNGCDALLRRRGVVVAAV